MEALDLELTQAVGGGTTLDSFMAALARDCVIMRNGSAAGRIGEIFD